MPCLRLSWFQVRTGHTRNLHKIWKACLVTSTATPCWGSNSSSSHWISYFSSLALSPEVCSMWWMVQVLHGQGWIPHKQIWAPFVLESSILFLYILVWTFYLEKPLVWTLVFWFNLSSFSPTFSLALSYSNFRCTTRCRGKQSFLDITQMGSATLIELLWYTWYKSMPISKWEKAD